MNQNEYEIYKTTIGYGIKKAGEHIGYGIAWFGFWLFLGMNSIEIITTVTKASGN